MPTKPQCLPRHNCPPTYHESLDDLKVVVDDLGQRSQAVGGARRIAAVEKDNYGR